MSDALRISLPTCIGGPFCGRELTVEPTVWNLQLHDALRKRIHLYDRRTPSDRAFYYSGSIPDAPTLEGDHPSCQA